jgi:hypothetical protein
MKEKHVQLSLVLPLLFALGATVGYFWFVLKITNLLEVFLFLVRT